MRVAQLDRSLPGLLVNQDFRPFDLVGFSGRPLSSRGIRLISHGLGSWNDPCDISHIGICFPWLGGRTALIESTTACEDPPIFVHTRMAGVQVHWPERRVPIYPGRVWHYRAQLAASEREGKELAKFLLDLNARPYDQLGALCAGLRIPREQAEQDQLAKLFCSELVAAALVEFQRYHGSIEVLPGQLIRRLIDAREYSARRIK